MYISYFQHMFTAYAGSNFRLQQRCDTLDRKCKTPELHVAATTGTVYYARLSMLVWELEIIPHLTATQQKTGENEQSGSLIWPRFIQQGCYSIRQFRGENSMGWDKTWWTGVAAGTATLSLGGNTLVPCQYAQITVTACLFRASCFRRLSSSRAWWMWWALGKTS